MNRSYSDTSEYRKAMLEELERRGMNIPQLARALGVDRVFVWHVVNGRKPGYRLRIRMVRELGFPLWILDGPQGSQRRRAA